MRLGEKICEDSQDFGRGFVRLGEDSLVHKTLGRIHKTLGKDS